VKKPALLVFVFILFAPLLPAFWDMQVYKTQQFTLFFPPGYEVRARQLIIDLESCKTIPEDIIGNKLYNLPVTLEDAGLYVQGYADPVFYHMAIFNQEDVEENWFMQGGVHEYTHMLQMTKTGGAPAVLTAIFGNVMSPNVFAPDWIFEGITVHNESRISQYSGRLNNGGFDSYLGMMTAEGLAPDIMKASYSPFEPPYGNAPYLFGGEFLGYLSKTYGVDKFKVFFESYGSSLMSYFNYILPGLGMDNTFREVYGKSTQELWKDWTDSVREKYRNFKMEGERITNRGFYTGEPLVYKDKIYYIYNGAEKTGVYETWGFHYIIERDLKSGDEKTVVWRTSQIINELKILDGKLYYCVNRVSSGYHNSFENGYGYEAALFERDLASGEERELFSDSINSFSPAAGGFVYYFNNDKNKFGSNLMVYNDRIKEKKLLYATDYFVTSLCATNDRNIYAVAARTADANRSIYFLDMTTYNFKAVVDTPWDEKEAVVYGNKIFFSSDMDMKLRAYCYDMDSGIICRLTDNGVAGTTAYDVSNNDLYFAGLNRDGFDIYRKKAVFEKIDIPFYPAKKEIVPAICDYKEGSYLDDLATLYPKIRYPAVGIKSDRSYELGVGMIGNDAADEISYQASIFYDKANNRAGTVMLADLLFFKPAYFETSYTSITGDLNLGLVAPVYSSSLGGLSNISTAVFYGIKPDSSEKYIVPQADFNFSFPFTALSVNFRAYFEKPWTGSQKNSESYIACGAINQYVSSSVLKISGGISKSSEEQQNFIGEVRGYDGLARGKKGVYAGAEFFKPLLKLRAGLWNPDIFFQDLVASVFIDSAYTEMESRLSCGAALHLETEMFFNVPMDIGVSEQRTKEGDFSTSLIFKIMM
jgi:hypothetical protein